ncbi:hypothetical protein [Marinicellulosiphila megalodicopiae]|uniref:hypothetical protein n=1 Tax=Marinicellulosiphila megalodicopiae TaxID=2724896 RepID=UPI003BB18BA4
MKLIIPVLLLVGLNACQISDFNSDSSSEETQMNTKTQTDTHSLTQTMTETEIDGINPNLEFDLFSDPNVNIITLNSVEKSNQYEGAAVKVSLSFDQQTNEIIVDATQSIVNVPDDHRINYYINLTANSFKNFFSTTAVSRHKVSKSGTYYVALNIEIISNMTNYTKSFIKVFESIDVVVENQENTNDYYVGAHMYSVIPTSDKKSIVGYNRMMNRLLELDLETGFIKNEVYLGDESFGLQYMKNGIIVFLTRVEDDLTNKITFDKLVVNAENITQAFRVSDIDYNTRMEQISGRIFVEKNILLNGDPYIKHALDLIDISKDEILDRVILENFGLFHSIENNKILYTEKIDINSIYFERFEVNEINVIDSKISIKKVNEIELETDRLHDTYIYSLINQDYLITSSGHLLNKYDYSVEGRLIDSANITDIYSDEKVNVFLMSDGKLLIYSKYLVLEKEYIVPGEVNEQGPAFIHESYQLVKMDDAILVVSGNDDGSDFYHYSIELNGAESSLSK